MELRPYQQDAINNARDEIKAGRKRLIVYAPTGAGKTIIAASIVESALQKEKRVLFLVHLRELAYQAIERFNEFGIGNQVGIIMAGEPVHLDRPVQVASIQTYIRRLALENTIVDWKVGADLVIYDEAHASIAKTRRDVLEKYPNSVILGLTATPCRSDGRGLGAVYEAIIPSSSIPGLINLGFLVPVIYYGCKEKPDLKSIRMTAGDYNKKELGRRVDIPKLIGDIFSNWARIAPDRQTVIFAVNVKHSRHIKEVFEANGVSIEHVDAHTPTEERLDVLNRFRSGDIQVVTNVGVYSEGADFPWASCIVLARPTKSYGRYIQMAGRGIRPFHMKENCIVIDHAGCVNEHGFVEDDVIWTLDDRDKAWEKKEPRKKEKTIMECKMCGFLFTGPKCPQCGTEVKNYGKKIAALDKDLEQLKGKKEKFTMEQKRVFYGMCEYYREKKGYNKGWSSHKYRERFGVWPNQLKDTGPIIPDDGFYNWMKHLNIKYAKGKEKYAKNNV